MMRYSTILSIAFLFLFGQMNAQKEMKITLNLLSGDKIAEVNVEQDRSVKDIGKIIDLVKQDFIDVPESQQVAILVNFHKTGKTTFEVYSEPKLDAAKTKHFLDEAAKLDLANTKLVDFPMVFNINSADGDMSALKDLVLPQDRIREEYKQGDIAKKIALNKAWALNEALPILAAFETKVEDKFAGVQNMGKLANGTDFSRSQNIPELTSHTFDYWRGVVEMNIGNQIIPATKIFMMTTQGDLDHAMKYLEITDMLSDPKTLTNGLLEDLHWRLNQFTKQVNAEVNRGIEQHDKENYQAAIDIYKNLLAIYPNSAWARYELYYSQNALDVKNGKRDAGDRSDWDKAKPEIYACNPVYPTDVRASNGKEGYLLFRRQEINSLFKKKEDKYDDLYKYGDIALDLGAYDFAAQMFWFSFSFTKDNEKALKRFLYCLEKLGVTDMKSNFKGDWDKEFAKIDKEREKTMKSSAMYKAFKE